MDQKEIFAQRFEIKELLGRGGMGEVYRAVELSTGRHVALKRLLSKYAENPKVRRRFLREARAFRRLRHPHIVEMYDSGESEEKLPYICMEFVQGRSLASLRDDTLGVDFIIRMVIQILDALAYSHGKGVVHRDVKPENIIVCDDESGREIAKLLDFGFARIGDEEGVGGETEAFGTPVYMAPEMVSQDKTIGPEADLYSVGVVIYELLCGRPPFQGGHGMAVALMHLMEPVPPMTTRSGHSIPIGLERIVMRALAKVPADRFRSASEMANELRTFSGISEKIAPLDGVSEAVSDALKSLSLPSSTSGSIAGQGDGEPIGRREELTWFSNHLKRIGRGGKGCVLMLGARQGMGRRHLLSWLRKTARRGGGVHVLSLGHRRHAGENQGGLLSLIIELLSAEMGVGEVSLAGCREWLRGLYTEAHVHGGDLNGKARALMRYLDDSGVDKEGVYIQPEIGGEWVEHSRDFTIDGVLAEIIAFSALSRPIVLTVGDLKRAGQGSLGFLSELAKRIVVDQVPVMLVVSYTRNHDLELDTSFVYEGVETIKEASQGRYEERILHPIGAEEFILLLRGLAPLDDAVATAVSNLTDGNPFHGSELVQLLWQTGQLVEQGGALTLARTASSANWPRDLSETMTRRVEITLARIDPTGLCRTILLRGSVLGEAFDFGLLVSFLKYEGHDEERVERIIELLIDAGLLLEPDGVVGDRIHFARSELHRIFAEEAARDPDYGRLCENAADTIRMHLGERLGSYSDRAAILYENAGKLFSAAESWQFGAQAARRSNYLELAIQKYARAEELLARGREPKYDIRRAEIWLELGETELLKGDVQRCRNLAAQVYQWAEREKKTHWEARALVLLGDALRAAKRPLQAARSYAKAATGFALSGDKHSLVRAMMGHAGLEREQGRLESALKTYLECDGHLPKYENFETRALIHLGLAEVYFGLNRLDDAQGAIHEAVREFSEVGDVPAVLGARLFSAQILMAAKQQREAIALKKEILNQAQDAKLIDIQTRVHEALSSSFEALADWSLSAHHLVSAAELFAGAGIDDKAADFLLRAARKQVRHCGFSQAYETLSRMPEAALAVDELDDASTKALRAWICLETNRNEEGQGMVEALIRMPGLNHLIDDELAYIFEGIAKNLKSAGQLKRGAFFQSRAALIRDALGVSG